MDRVTRADSWLVPAKLRSAAQNHPAAGILHNLAEQIELLRIGRGCNEAMMPWMMKLQTRCLNECQ